jgi:hypothetical protein
MVRDLTWITKQLTPPVPCVKTVMPAFKIKGPNARAFMAVPAAAGGGSDFLKCEVWWSRNELFIFLLSC